MTQRVEQTTPQPAVFPRRLPAAVGCTFTFGLLLLLAALDLLTWGVNLSILYIVPLMIYAQTARSRFFPGLGVLMIVLTYAKIFVWTPALLTHPHDPIHDYPAMLMSQLVNRSFVAVTLAVCTVLLHRWRRFQSRWQLAGTPMTDMRMNGALLGQSFDAMGRTVGIMVALTLAAAIFATDLFTPEQINSPILYLVPLTVIGMSARGRVVWVAALAFIVMAAIAWKFGAPPSLEKAVASSQPMISVLWGPAPSRRQVIVTHLITNRALACAMLLITAGLLQRPRARPN